MKVQEVMERANMTETGRAIAYIKDALEEIELHAKENVISGSRTSVTASTISFDAEETEAITNGTSWTDATGATEPAGWSEYEHQVGGGDITNMHFDIVDGTLKITAKEAISAIEKQGMYQAFTAIIGVKYKLSFDIIYNNLQLRVAIGNNAPSSSTVQTQMVSYINGSSATGVGITETHTEDFIATDTSPVITVYVYGLPAVSSGEYSYIDNVSVTPYHTIRDTASGLGNFTTDMKLRVDGSSSNDTDESDNTSTGHYTPTSITSDGQYISVSDTLTTESAGNTITLIGTERNYMDIIEGKRYYPFPSDMLKLVSVKAKNHLNNEDKYREIPRAIHEPLEEDGDNI